MANVTPIRNGVLETNLDASNFAIKNVGDPVDPQDVSTRAYVLANTGGSLTVVANATARYAGTWKFGDVIEQTDTLHRWLVCDVAHLGSDTGYQDLGAKYVPPPPFATNVTDISNWSVTGGTALLDGNGNVTFDTPGSVVSINAYTGFAGNSIVNASGCPALTYLNLNFASITTPPVLTGLTALQYLSFSYAAITTPPDLTGLTSLQFLYIQNTGITTPPDLTGLTALHSIYIQNTAITTPPVLTGLTALLELCLNNTAIADASLIDAVFSQLDADGASNGYVNTSGGTNAGPTSASAAARASLVAKGWTVVTNTPSSSQPIFATNVTSIAGWSVIGGTPSLDGSGNVTFDTPGSVTSISANAGFASNSIVDASICPALHYLSLDGTAITTPPTLTGLTALQGIDLGFAGITTPPILTGLTALQYLDLRYGQISDSSLIDAVFSQLDADGASNGYVNTSGTDIFPVAAPTSASAAARASLVAKGWTVVTNTPSVQAIFATNVTSIAGWSVPGGTSSLDGSGNVTFDTPGSVNTINANSGFASNSVVNASICPALLYLYLGGTSITTPPVLTGLTALQQLDLYGTPITTPPDLTGLTALLYLNLRYTAITDSSLIDAMFTQLDSNGATNGYVNTSGTDPSNTTAAPTSASAAARASLVTKGWTIVTN